MARVRRFIYNSDFLTIAKASRQVFNFTIPGHETSGGSYYGTLTQSVDIPANSFTRSRIKYVGQYGTIDMAVASYFLMTATKNGKQIQYFCSLSCEDGKVNLDYTVINATDSSTVLADAQTFELTIDFLTQPNT
jgi:hypothetical protein